MFNFIYLLCMQFKCLLYIGNMNENTIGKEAMIGAGSVITKDVPSKALGIERNDQKNIEGYMDRKKKND